MLNIVSDDIVLYRGTTPTIYLETNLTATSIQTLFITLVQYQGSGAAPVTIEKTKTDCTVSDYKISFSLSQAETLSFNKYDVISMQARVILSDNKVDASNIVTFYIEDILKDGAISSVN